MATTPGWAARSPSRCSAATLARDNTFLARFRREAQSAAGLNHASIVAVYDHGEDILTETGGAQVKVPYIVMEFVDGKTLRQVITERGTVGPTEALRITEGVLDALGYSHRNGIVHRDIKPAQRDDRRRRLDQGDGLRHRPGDGRRQRHDDPDLGRHRHRPVPLARAGPGPVGRRALRPLLHRLHALRAAHRPPAVPRREPGLDRLPARRRAADPAVAARRGHLRGPRRRRAALAGQAARRPLPERRRVPRRPAGGAPGPTDQRRRPRLGRRPRRRRCAAPPRTQVVPTVGGDETQAYGRSLPLPVDGPAPRPSRARGAARRRSAAPAAGSCSPSSPSRRWPPWPTGCRPTSAPRRPPRSPCRASSA